MTVDEIAKTTRRSRPTVYRALEQARAQGWLDDQPRLTMPPGAERTELEEHVADLRKAKQVKDEFAREERPEEVIVVPTPPASRGERLSAAVCGALRHSPAYRKVHDTDPAPNWDPHLPGLIVEALEFPEVLEAGGTKDNVAPLIRKYADGPFTTREFGRARRVGRAAAARFCRAVDEGAVKLAGISWGYHVFSFVNAAVMEFPAYWNERAEGRSRAANARRLQLFPLIGSLGLDPIRDEREYGTKAGANANAGRLASHIGAAEPLSLTQPAYIPEAFYDPTPLRQIWEYIQEDQSVQRVFGPCLADKRVSVDGVPLPDPAEQLLDGSVDELQTAGCVGNADALITGIGTCSWDSRAPRLGILSDSELEGLQASGAVGDAAGQFFWDPMMPPSAEQRGFIRWVNARFISPRLADFVAATQRARASSEGALGSMILASGKQKAPALRALCRWQACHILCVDSELADELIGGK